MKKVLSMLILLMMAGTMSAQAPSRPEKRNNGGQPRMAQRKFQIIVENEKKTAAIQETNDRLSAMQASARSEAQRGLLGDLLWQGFTSSFKQKTVNATSNLVSLGMNYVTEAMKSKREKWYRQAQKQCYYSQKLSAESKIDDFYAAPSTKGAMDPENLKFEGFGCKNYIEVTDGSKEGVGVFYIFCKMRRDSIGLRHIVNHSKFWVEIDSLVINPTYCNLPNDSTGSLNERFSFEKRDNLNLELKVNFYSSWMNQATMITNDQLLGEFTVNVRVDKNKLNADGLFVYDKNDPEYQRLVSLDGDCYIVPRSYTGTTDGVSYQPSWGTGQYRIEMTVSERCSIVDSYYQIRESGNGEAVAFADATPGKKKWDKAKWQVEWKAMNARHKDTPFLTNAWNCIVTAYKGSGWMATLTDPATTALYSWETQKLGDWIDDLHEKLFDGDAGSTPAVGATAPTGANPTSGGQAGQGQGGQGNKGQGQGPGQGGQGQGGQPKGGGRP